MSNTKAVAAEFVNFLNKAVSPYHAVEECATLLRTAGFNELKESDTWKLEPRKKVKPVSRLSGAGCLQLGVMTYGGGLWRTWFDRDLTVAGRAMVLENCEQSKEIDHHEEFLQKLADEAGVKASDILDFDLCVVDTQPAVIGGLNDEFIYGARLDNLIGTYSSITALINSCHSDGSLEKDPNIRLTACYDNEECGSESAQGAASSLTEWILRRLQCDASTNMCAFEQSIARSLLISADQAHALHPNYASKHDDKHAPHFHAGPVIKVNANQRYATTTWTHALIKLIAERADVPLQKYVVRNDSLCGSTVGPILSAKLGLKTIDIGMPQLAMHSVREMACTSVLFQAQKLLTKKRVGPSTTWRRVCELHFVDGSPTSQNPLPTQRLSHLQTPPSTPPLHKGEASNFSTPKIVEHASCERVGGVKTKQRSMPNLGPPQVMNSTSLEVTPTVQMSYKTEGLRQQRRTKGSIHDVVLNKPEDAHSGPQDISEDFNPPLLTRMKNKGDNVPNFSRVRESRAVKSAQKSLTDLRPSSRVMRNLVDIAAKSNESRVMGGRKKQAASVTATNTTEASGSTKKVAMLTSESNDSTTVTSPDFTFRPSKRTCKEVVDSKPCSHCGKELSMIKRDLRNLEDKLDNVCSLLRSLIDNSPGNHNQANVEQSCQSQISQQYNLVKCSNEVSVEDSLNITATATEVGNALSSDVVKLDGNPEQTAVTMCNAAPNSNESKPADLAEDFPNERMSLNGHISLIGTFEEGKKPSIDSLELNEENYAMVVDEQRNENVASLELKSDETNGILENGLKLTLKQDYETSVFGSSFVFLCCKEMHRPEVKCAVARAALLFGGRALSVEHIKDYGPTWLSGIPREEIEDVFECLVKQGILEKCGQFEWNRSKTPQGGDGNEKNGHEITLYRKLLPDETKEKHICAYGVTISAYFASYAQKPKIAAELNKLCE